MVIYLIIGNNVNDPIPTGQHNGRSMWSPYYLCFTDGYPSCIYQYGFDAMQSLITNK